MLEKYRGSSPIVYTNLKIDLGSSINFHDEFTHETNFHPFTKRHFTEISRRNSYFLSLDFCMEYFTLKFCEQIIHEISEMCIKHEFFMKLNSRPTLFFPQNCMNTIEGERKLSQPQALGSSTSSNACCCECEHLILGHDRHFEKFEKFHEIWYFSKRNFIIFLISE